MVDKKVVIPDDMGAGLKFENDKWNVNAGKGLTINQTTNQIEIKTGGGAGGTGTGPSTGVGVNSDGKLTVLRSPDAGNLLELRDNGLYYGITPIQSHFYVDSTEGDDNNDGATPERPMRTIQKAVDSMVDGPYSYTIYLRCLKTFDLCYKTFNVVEQIKIRPYGPEMALYPLGYDTDPLYDGALAVSFPRPTIMVRTHPWIFNNSRVMARNFLSANSFYITGIILDVNITPQNDDKTIQGYLPGIFNTPNGRVEFNGCDINVYGDVIDLSNHASKYRYDALFRCNSIMFGSCRWRNKLPEGTGDVCYVDTVLISAYKRMDSLISVDGKYPSYPIFQPNDILPNLPLNTIRQQSSWDTTTKSLFGFTTSWDIFQYPN